MSVQRIEEAMAKGTRYFRQLSARTILIKKVSVYFMRKFNDVLSID